MTIVRIKPRLWWPGINRQDPIARGLLGYWPMWEGAGSGVGDVAGHNDGVIQDVVDWVVDGIDCDGIGDGMSHPSLGFSGRQPISVLAVLTYSFIGSDRSFFGQATQIVFRISPSGELEFILNSLGSPDRISVAHNFVVGKLSAVLATFDGTKFALYQDGRQLNTLTAGSGNYVDTADSYTWGFSEDLLDFTGVTHTGAIWNRGLSSGEGRLITRDPYRLITLPKRTVVFGAGVPAPPPAGGVPKLVNRGLINTGPLSGLVV